MVWAGLPPSMLAALRARYGEPHRRYHDERHLDAVLGHVEDLAAHADDVDAVRLAAWFHDAVYDPTRTDNEDRSGALAEAALAGHGADPRLTAEVARLVRLTTRHDPAPGDRNGAVLCDADLAILASPDASYAAYALAVRAEHDHVDDRDFAAGRAAVLVDLLDRPGLFRTPSGLERWEKPARRNLTGELDRLRAAVASVAADPLL